MSSFVRASKFRHVFCDPPRPGILYIDNNNNLKNLYNTINNNKIH